MHKSRSPNSYKASRIHRSSGYCSLIIFLPWLMHFKASRYYKKNTSLSEILNIITCVFQRKNTNQSYIFVPHLPSSMVCIIRQQWYVIRAFSKLLRNGNIDNRCISMNWWGLWGSKRWRLSPGRRIWRHLNSRSWHFHIKWACINWWSQGSGSFPVGKCIMGHFIVPRWFLVVSHVTYN